MASFYRQVVDRCRGKNFQNLTLSTPFKMKFSLLIACGQEILIGEGGENEDQEVELI
jgi:hypothetical protein